MWIWVCVCVCVGGYRSHLELHVWGRTPKAGGSEPSLHLKRFWVRTEDTAHKLSLHKLSRIGTMAAGTTRQGADVDETTEMQRLNNAAYAKIARQRQQKKAAPSNRTSALWDTALTTSLLGTNTDVGDVQDGDASGHDVA
eukprot:m.1487205 g.1487205  ORF g.1487205 m.1487205 type:complete len:140 (+) comp25185_c1_seq7:4755-5174(+)